MSSLYINFDSISWIESSTNNIFLHCVDGSVITLDFKYECLKDSEFYSIKDKFSNKIIRLWNNLFVKNNIRSIEVSGCFLNIVFIGGSSFKYQGFDEEVNEIATNILSSLK